MQGSRKPISGFFISHTYEGVLVHKALQDRVCEPSFYECALQYARLWFATILLYSFCKSRIFHRDELAF